jgi:beta-lactam-binding protein with PASTA domain
MRRLFRLLALALLLLLVALASAMTAMRMAIHGREVEVPKLTALTQREAEQALSSRGLLLAIENRFYSGEVPEGRIVSQAPQPGTKVRRGWRVRVAQSLGAPSMTVPNVVGQSQRAAEINVRRRGLEVGTVAVMNLPGMAGEEVVAQSPPADAKTVSSPKISLLVAAGEEHEPLVMPSFVGRPLADAASEIRLAGLKLSPIAETEAEGPAQRTVIARQWPAAGHKVYPGTVVSLEVVK